MWRTVLSIFARLVLGAVVLVAGAVGWFFLSASAGSYHTIFDCRGALQSRTANTEIAADAYVDLEQFHWFKMKVGDIAGMAKVEMIEPPLFNILYVFQSGDNHLNLHHIPNSGEDKGKYAGGFSLLSRSLVVEVAGGHVFDGRCLARGG